MEVYGLVGASGTGKSYRALALAHEYQIDVIIDDGLLIKDSRIITGNSAKRQSTRVGAIKTALFSDQRHAEEATSALDRLKPSRILILGTSGKMVELISQRLNLPGVAKIIRIEDVATNSEITNALQSRRSLGQHVIPAPTVEVKPKLSGTIIEPLRTFFKKGVVTEDYPKEIWVEQTVVRPTFNYLGRFYIANNVPWQIATAAAKEIPGLQQIVKFNAETTIEGITVNLDITLTPDRPFREVAKELQCKVAEQIEYMTSLNVVAVNVNIKSVFVAS